LATHVVPRLSTRENSEAMTFGYQGLVELIICYYRSTISQVRVIYRTNSKNVQIQANVLCCI